MCEKSSFRKSWVFPGDQSNETESLQKGSKSTFWNARSAKTAVCYDRCFRRRITCRSISRLLIFRTRAPKALARSLEWKNFLVRGREDARLGKHIETSFVRFSYITRNYAIFRGLYRNFFLSNGAKLSTLQSHKTYKNVGWYDTFTWGPSDKVSWVRRRSARDGQNTSRATRASILSCDSDATEIKRKNRLIAQRCPEPKLATFSFWMCRTGRVRVTSTLLILLIPECSSAS